jgi:hypothetical protein
MNTSHLYFADIKKSTRKIFLKDQESRLFCNDQEFRDSILGKINSTEHQLHLYLRQVKQYEEIEDMLNSILAIRVNNLSLYSCCPGGKLEMKFMKQFENIRHLKLLNYKLSNFPTLPSYMNRIAVLFCEGIPQWDSINFQHLRQVSLTLSDIVNVDCFANLQSLKLFLCRNIIDVSKLGNIPELRIEDCLKIEDISHLTNNRKLTIYRCQNVKNYNFLSNAEVIRIGPVSHPIDFKNFPHVKNLSIAHEREGGEFLQSFLPSSLEKLECQYSFSSIVLNGLNHLYAVRIDNCRTVTNLNGLENIPIVEIVICPILTDISALRKQKKVLIMKCPKIQDYSSLQEITSIYLHSQMNIQNLTPLKNVHTFRMNSYREDFDFTNIGIVHSIDLSLCSSITSLEGLKNIPEISIKDCKGIISMKGLGKNQKVKIHDNLSRYGEESYLPFLPMSEYSIEKEYHTITFYRKTA